MSDQEVVVGVPSACLLPAAKYGFTEVVGLTTLSLPIRGRFPEDFPVQGEYDICPEPGVVLMGKITEALFAFGKYPDLQPNQRFVLAGVQVLDDKVDVVGRIVQFVEETDVEEV